MWGDCVIFVTPYLLFLAVFVVMIVDAKVLAGLLGLGFTIVFIAMGVVFWWLPEKRAMDRVRREHPWFYGKQKKGGKNE